MERPAKRVRLASPQPSALPTRTIPLADLRKRKRPYSSERHVLPDNVGAAQLRPRAPQVTVTASVVDVQVEDGTTTLASTEIAAATTDTVVPVSDLGSVTIPALATTTSNSTTSSSSSSDTITTTSTSISNPFSSIASSLINGNSTITSNDTTVTVTATSTFDITYSNGTFIPAITTSHSHETHRNHTTTKHHSSNDTVIFTSGTFSTVSSISNSSITAPVSSSGSSTSTGTVLPGASITSTDTQSTGTESSSTASPTSTSPPAGPGLTPKQQSVVGGVIGGTAGLALILVVILMFLRWYRSRLKSQGRLPEQLRDRNSSRRHIRGISSVGGGSGLGYEMTQTPNNPLAAALASSLRKWRPHSAGTHATGSSFTGAEATASERGFQKIAGRKLGPVLSTGGDQYGGNFGAFEKDINPSPAHPATDQRAVQRNLSRTSFYRDSRGFYGGGASPVPPNLQQQQRSSSVPGSPRASESPRSSSRDFADSFPMPPANSPAAPLVGPPGSPLKSRSEINLPMSSSLPTSPRMTGMNSPLRAVTRPDGFAVMRPSPARTPTTSSLNDGISTFSAPGTSISHPSPPMMARTEGLVLLDPEAPPTPTLPENMSFDGGRGRHLAPMGRPRVGGSASPGGRNVSSRFREVV